MFSSKGMLAAAAIALVAQAANAADISVSNPYVRAVPPGQPNSAAFMSLTNGTSEARALVGADSDAAKVVELHTHVKEGGMMRMRQVAEIALPAGETVRLEPGGLHIMLIGLERPLTPGDEIGLKLHFDDGREAAVKAPVRQIDTSQIRRHQ